MNVKEQSLDALRIAFAEGGKGGKDITSSIYSKGSISVSKVTEDIVIVDTTDKTNNDLVITENCTYGK